MELNASELKGKKAYWRASYIWCVAVAFGIATYAVHPEMSLIGKVVIAAGLVVSAAFLFKASDPARYFAGAISLLGILMNLPAACSVFEKETQVGGLLSLCVLVLCALVWHAFLISDDVSAYLRKYRREKGLPPGD